MVDDNSAQQGERSSSKPEPARRGIVCLFCGAHTLLPATAARQVVATEPAHNPCVWNVRCRACGKEALYAAHEVFDTHDLSTMNRLRTCAAGSN
jgi:hypothetical protein